MRKINFNKLTDIFLTVTLISIWLFVIGVIIAFSASENKTDFINLKQIYVLVPGCLMVVSFLCAVTCYALPDNLRQSKPRNKN